ncbi:MAG: hypothetical protein L3J10_03510 [Sulfurimonas sp.]|nr:hypothetical protein [Sulfurimonas sp.]
MQRKNNILKIYPHKNRDGFAMIMAIAVIIIISTIMALSLSLTTKTSKKTTDIYLYEQAILYSKSAAELALLDIADNGPCVNVGPYPFEGGLYNATVTLLYVYRGLDCTTFIPPANNYFTTLQTDKQSGSVLMDITVTTNAGTEPIRYFRRSIQKL